MRPGWHAVLCAALLLGCGSGAEKGRGTPDAPSTGGMPIAPDTAGTTQPSAPVVCDDTAGTVRGAADVAAPPRTSAPPSSGGAQRASPPPAQCAGLTVATDVVMRRHVVSRGAMWCGAAVGDASGALALPSAFSSGMAFGASIDFVRTTGDLLGEYGSHDGTQLVEQPQGFAAASSPRFGHGPPTISQLRWDSDARMLAGGDAWWSKTWPYRVAADPNGGVLLVGDVSSSNLGTVQHAAVMFEGGGVPYGTRWGPVKLASSGTVLGAGVDALGRAIVMTDGSTRFAPGAVSAQWFDRDGAAMTGEFLLLERSIADPCRYVWLETSPLVGGGVAVRRMAERFPASIEAQALVVVASGADRAQPAPDWMTSRPGTRLVLLRSGQGYAVLPYGARGVDCTQRVELLAADGTPCASIDFPISDGRCDTGELSLGADGTVVQQLPASMETPVDSTVAHTCTWRFWPQVLR